MRKGTMAHMNYLWLKGQTLRDKHYIIWWAGYKAAHVGLDDVVTKGMNWNDSEVEAFHSGFQYYQEANRG